MDQPTLEVQETARTKPKASLFFAQKLADMARKESDPKRRAQIEAAESLYGHLSGVYTTAAGARSTAEAMGIRTRRYKHEQSLDTYLRRILGKKGREKIEVLNIGDPYLRTANQHVTVLDPIIKARKQGGVKAVIGVFPATPFAKESFDAIVCKNSIGYPMTYMSSEQIEVVMDELLRLTKKEGMIFINSIEYDGDDTSEMYFSVVRNVLERLHQDGVVDYDCDKDVYSAEPVGNTPPAANTSYTLRIKKTSDYSPSPFPRDIIDEAAQAYLQTYPDI